MQIRQFGARAAGVERPTSDVTSLDVPGDALARLYLMVVRGSARKALSCGRAC